MARSNLTTVLFAAVLLSTTLVSVHAQSLGGFCVANSYSTTTTTTTTTVAALKNNANTTSLGSGSCLPSLSTGFFTITGFITSTANGKGLGSTPNAQQAWITDANSGTFTMGTGMMGTGLSLYFAVTNAVNRGDYVTVVGYLTSISGSAVLEVCVTPVYPIGGPTYSAAAYTATSVTTSMFSSPSLLNGTVGARFVTPSFSNSSYQPNGGACLTSNKGYDGSLATFSNVKVLSCANTAVSNLIGTAASGNVVRAYSVCNPSMSPLADTYVSGVCTSCLYDKYSQFFISSDNGVTGITVSSKFFRAFAVYQMQVASGLGTTSFSITGVLSYSGPGSGANSQWMLVPRDQNDVSGLTALGTSGSYPTILIGDFVNGVKQQTYKYASPGPTLPLPIDPSGVTAAANLPLGTPANILGPLDTINSAGSSYPGTGVYFPTLTTTNPGVPGTTGNPYWSGCPNASSFTWIYNQGSTYQNLCTCYPPRYYSPALGSNGGGTTYVQATGVVSFIEGVTTGTGVGSFFMQSGCGPNQQLYVYQDGAAGKSVSIGDNVTITATAYAYYGLVQMSNTINVVVNSRNNAVCPPLQMTDLSVLDVARQGHCSASTVLYRANVVIIKQVTVTKLVMYEPYPTAFNYYYNGTNQALYSAGFNSTIGLSGKALGTWGPGTIYNTTSGSVSCSVGKACGNWFNSDPAKTVLGAQVVHPVTGNSFPATFEVTDGYGNYLLIDQCPYGSQGGLLKAFLGTDGVTTPLAVGDTFLSITGLLKYSRGGSYREGLQGGNLMLCATSDPSLLVGRNQPFPSSSGAALAYYSASLSGVTGATFASTVLMQSAFKTGVSNLANVSYGSVNITAITDISTRRHLLGAAVNVAFSIASASAGTAAAVGALLTTSALSTALTASFLAVGLTPLIVNSLQGSGSTTTVDNKTAVKLGLGLGIGLGLGLVLILVVLYFTVLKKKNIQTGQRSAVMLSPMPAPAEGKA